jgi:hypothetical protein
MRTQPMRNRAISTPSPILLDGKYCTDPIVGAILSGWRYDISSISREMRTDYEVHLSECLHCRRRQHAARTMDVLLISVSSLSIVAFLLAAAVMHRVEMLAHIAGSVTLHLRQTPVAVSLEAVAIAGLVISMVLWVLVAISTPLPGIVSSMVEQRIPSDIRQRFARRHA